MKRKLLSLLLVITLLAITISTGIPSILATNGNLIANGDFSSYSGNLPTGWKVMLPNSGTPTYEMVEDVELPGGTTANAIKFTTPQTHISLNNDGKYVALDSTGTDARIYFSNTETVKIEKNATYTMTFWAKVKKIHALSVLMFEPGYGIRQSNGTYRYFDYGVEGHNLYCYKTDAATLRNARPEITNLWTVADTGAVIASFPSSMFISRSTTYGDPKYMYEQPLTPDFPSHDEEGEWVKVVHTFSTDNKDSHEADVCYTFRFPQVAGGEVWIADVQMNVQKAQVDGYYTPTNSTPELGAVSENLILPRGKTVTMTAEPFGENKFEGWYKGDTLVSKDSTYSFTYDPANPPAYEARFTKAKWGTNGSLEDLAAGTAANIGFSSTADWSATAFKNATVNGKFFADSVSGGKSAAVNISSTKAHTGTKAAEYVGQSGYVGYKFTGLNKNTSYIFSTYAYVASDVTTDAVTGVYLTDANSGVTKLASGSLAYKTATDDGVRYYSNATVECRNEWKKIEVKANIGDSTEVILWVSTPASGANLYLDNFAIAREPYKFAPKSSDYNLGFVSPIGGADAYENENVTVTATPLDGNGFDGWYLGNQRVSTSLSYTHKYDPTNTNMANLTAKFTAGPTAITGAGFENQGYTSNQQLVIHTNGYIKADGETCDQSSLTNKGNWSVDSYHDGRWQQVTVDTTFAHTGTTSMRLDARNGWAGYTVKGLTPNTKYSFSFYAWAFDNKAGTVNGLNSVIVTNAGERPIHKTSSGWTNRRYNEALGGVRSVVDCREGWTKVTTPFTTSSNGDVTLWINVVGDGTQNIHVDNIAVYESVSFRALTSLGGTITSNITESEVAKGSYIELSATPLEGNTFTGWYNTESGELVSANANYNFNITAPISLVAKFEGDNMPPTDILKIQGMDGTIEEGTVAGWWADDPVHTDVNWCRWERNTEIAYEGNYSLKGYCRYRSTNLTLSNLTANTDYHFSLYVNVCGAANADGSDKYTRYDQFGIMGPAEKYLENATDVLVSRPALKGNMGWQRLDFYFNSGERTEVIFSAKLVAEDGGVVYYDNISLVQYEADEQPESTAFSVNEGKNNFQTLSVEPYNTYTVKFRAKGNGTVAAQKLLGQTLDIKEYVTSVSSVEVASDDFKEYSFDVYSGVHEAMNILANGGEGGIEIESLEFVHKADSSGAIFEKIDFETERFGLSSNTDRNMYSIYTATDENDTNVLNGSKSLKFTYNQLLDSSTFKIDEGWASYQVGERSIKVSFNYKMADGKDGGSVKFAPESTGTYGMDVGYEHIPKDDGWNLVEFFVTNDDNLPVFKMLISNVANMTKGDFYIDDIIISIPPPTVIEENSSNTYCEQLYNAVENEGFEQKLTNNDWKGLGSVSTAKVMSGNALKGTKYLRANAGTHYVVEVDVKPDSTYYFGASLRGTAKSNGYIGIAFDNKGLEYYPNVNKQPASKIYNKKTTTDWSRNGFKFTTDASGKAYLVIHVDSGYIDIDSVMMFAKDFSYRYDPNDYTVYVPYDYNNLKSSTTVINGGFGSQPYYKAADKDEVVSLGSSSADVDGTPETGDSIFYPVVSLVVMALALAVIVFIKKRKEGANADA